MQNALTLHKKVNNKYNMYMKKKFTQFKWLVTTLLLVTAMAMPKMAWAEIKTTPPSGDGTADSPYQIGTPEELYWFAALVNGTLEGETQNKSANAVLTADITVNTGVLKSGGTLADDVTSFTTWTPIGNSVSNPFTGTFDGQGHTISGMYFDNEKIDYVGLFGCNGGTIKYVGVVDSYFRGNYFVGGVCGKNYTQNATATISNCYNTGAVSGITFVGGVCGNNLACDSYSTSTITNCYNTGTVSEDLIGGSVCGKNSATNGGTATITYCYYNSEKYTGNAIGVNAGTVEKVEGKTTAQFKSGEVCYLLNNSTSESTQVWYQNIGSETSDASPVLDNTHGTVYKGYEGCKKVYSNTNNLNQTKGNHSSYDNGICTACGEYQPATKNSSDQYEIGNAGQLYWFVALVNGTLEGETQNKSANAVLTADITVNTGVLKSGGTLADDVTSFTTWTPIGNSVSNPFTGTFDGQGHTISGLYFDNEKIDYVGLFGCNGGTIKNVGVVDSYFRGNYFVGGVCGYNYNQDSGTSTITNCYNTGSVSGISYVGGVCGYNYAKNSSTSTITNCYNTGSVSCSGEYYYAGGVCGYNYAEIYSTSTITNCYTTGSVSGSRNVGGVCGYNEVCLEEATATITNCYYNSEKYTGKAIGTNTGTVEKVVGKTTAQFKSGEVCYLLNNGTTDGTQAWYQNLSAEGGDAYPHLNDTEKENKTVYGAYIHGETTLTYRNDNNNTHAHAYDSSATDEESGNHDKSYQGDFTWADNDDKTNATVAATFTCSVCGKVVTPAVTAVKDTENSKLVTCTEDGTNIYTASHSFAGNTLTDIHTQTLTALGHDMTGDVSLNSGQHIYQKVCKRDGCGHADYYATSNGSVVAKLEDGIYKVASFDLADATAYNSEAEFTVTSLAYKRKFYDDKWMAVYVPFAIDCSKLDADYEMATINNFHEYEQEDGTYNVVLEVKRVTKGGTIPALTPCLMRIKTAPEAEVEKTLTFENAAFSAAADKSIDCSSVTRYYQFFGTLNGKTGLNAATDFVLNEGKLYKTSKSTVLLPQRWYLSATDRTSTPVEPAAMLRSISIKVIGDGEATGIEDIHVNTELGADASGSTGIYDLQGRKINSEPTKGMYIKNGKKYIK